jgi:hypothetical protein
MIASPKANYLSHECAFRAVRRHCDSGKQHRLIASWLSHKDKSSLRRSVAPANFAGQI